MPLEIRERELPGVGVRYEIDLTQNESIATVIHNNGRRGLYVRGEGSDEYKRVSELSDSQARALGLVLVGAYYQPVPTRTGEVTPTDEHVKWYQIGPNAGVNGKSIGEIALESQNGAAILAVVRNGERTANPEDGFTLAADDQLVIIGDQKAHGELDGILHGE